MIYFPLKKGGSRRSGIAAAPAICYNSAVPAAITEMNRTLLPFNPDWRWMLNREDSPWYPTMRLFRQPSFGDWESMIARVAGELRNPASKELFSP